MASREELEWWNKFADVMAEQWMLTPRLNMMIRSEYEQDYGDYLFRSGGSFLEIGCGAGWIGHKFAARGMHVDGLDFSQSQLDIARHLAAEKGLDNVAYFARDLVNDPLHGRFERYDAILVNAVLHHLSPAEVSALNCRLAGLLAPDGRLYLYEPLAPRGESVARRLLMAPFSFTMRVVLFTIQRIGKTFGLFKRNFAEAMSQGYTGTSPDERAIPLADLRRSLVDNGLTIVEERPYHSFSLAVAMSIMRLQPSLLERLTPVVRVFYGLDRWLFRVVGWQNFGDEKAVLCSIKATKTAAAACRPQSLSAIPDVVHHTSCPLCGGVASDHLTETRDLHYGIAGQWRYQRCADCRVVFLNPAPTAEFLAGAYDDSYYSYQDFAPTPAWRRWVRTLTGFNPGTTGDPVFARPGKVLDIGCGSGQFLYRMKLQGWETHGVELSARAAEIGNTRYALNIQAGTLRQAQLPDGSFDYIRLNHSFEHLLDPRETLDRIRELLAPQGLLFIGVPNVDGLQARWFGKHWWNLGPPVHPFNYSRFTLQRLLTEHGFEMLRFRTHSNFAGILGSLQMRLNDRRDQAIDTGALLRNPVAKLLTHWVARITDLFSAGDCLELVARRRGT